MIVVVVVVVVAVLIVVTRIITNAPDVKPFFKMANLILTLRPEPLV